MAEELAGEGGLTVAVIGTGFIGTSIAGGLLASGFATEVLGDDLDPEALQRAKVTRPLKLPDDAPRVQIWVLALPPDGINLWLHRLAPMAHPDSVITDTASVKESISASVPDEIRGRFVGGHPLRSGSQGDAESPHPNLFEDLHWILTPGDASEASIKRIEQMVFALDAIPIHMTPTDHDRHLAALSHLPVSLGSLLSGLKKDLLFAHVSTAEWPQQASVNPDLWAQILLHNRQEVREALVVFERRLHEFVEALDSGDSASIRRFLTDEPN